LKLPAASETGTAAVAATPTSTSNATTTSNPASKGAATTGIVLGIIGIALGTTALLLVLLRGRRQVQ
jgi:hypothetical protein